MCQPASYTRAALHCPARTAPLARPCARNSARRASPILPCGLSLPTGSCLGVLPMYSASLQSFSSRLAGGATFEAFSNPFHIKLSPEMDPLSSLGVAGNVIQFVDFGIKLVSRFNQIYRSADGALQENTQLSEVRPFSLFGCVSTNRKAG